MFQILHPHTRAMHTGGLNQTTSEESLGKKRSSFIAKKCVWAFEISVAMH
jgi:hypothetical protein